MTVHEIAIRRPRSALVLYGIAPMGDWQPLPVAELFAQLEGAKARGVRAVLIDIDSPGGEADAGLVLFNILRSLSEMGLRSVAHLRLAASTTAWWPLGCDYLVADPSARVLIHSALGLVDGAPRARDPEDHARELAICCGRTLVPPAEVERWMRTGEDGRPPWFVELNAARAVEVGWCDFAGPIDLARNIAVGLAAGADVPSPRRAALAARGDGEWFAALRSARARGGLLMATHMKGVFK
jgi:hypothetical protein